MGKPSDPDPLRALRARRTERRTAGIDRFDAFYRAYITALFASIAVFIVSSWVGDADLSASATSRFLSDGPPILGAVAAVVIALGLRSGSHGGPFAVEAADVQHVLLGPVPASEVFGVPALRQLRFVSFAAALSGAIAGQLVVRRLEGAALAWVACGALFFTATVVVGLGSAWIAGGLRLRPGIATVAGAGLLGWSGLDIAGVVPGAPTTWLARAAFWPLEFAPGSILALVVVAGVAVVGFRTLPGSSIEKLSRRSALVGEIRFAATTRDIRTVMLLRRQLTQEYARSRPWVRGSRRAHLTVVFRRDVRALARIPVSRLLRMLVLGVAAALLARAAWEGTTPLIVVAGMASFMVALEALEPLAQEIDHPTLLGLSFRTRGPILLQHLLVPLLSTTVVALMGLGVVAAFTGLSSDGLAIAGVTLVAAVLTSLAGAAVSVVKSGVDPDAGNSSSFMPPEAAGMGLLVQAAGPPALAIVGFLPVVQARGAFDDGLDPVAAASSPLSLLIIVVALVVAWVRYRDDMHHWWRTAAAQATGTKPAAG